MHSKCLDLPARWSVYRTKPGALDEPGALSALAAEYEAGIPSTVASLVAAGQGDRGALSMPIDAFDWWYLSEPFEIPGGEVCLLEFDGLATLADVWLNDEPVLRTRNMFRSYSVEVPRERPAVNRLAIVFRSVTADLATRRPRPRWKTNLVDQQQLRWYRTTLLGRMPGWSSGRPAIGPWRDIRAQVGSACIVQRRLRPWFDGEAAGLEIELALRAEVASTAGWKFDCVIDGARHPLTASCGAGHLKLSGDIRLQAARLWWPHTAGNPELYDYRVEVTDEATAGVIALCSGRVGFRSVHMDSEPGRVRIAVNDRPIFCRGACWTVADVNLLQGTPNSVRRSLEAIRDAGGNMIRIGGTMTYEPDWFYELCDELGLMVWQDFMFANMDYPGEDPEFASEVQTEIDEQIQRLSRFACVVTYCGNSEVEQQAAMMGVPPEQYANRLFSELIPARLAEHNPGTSYVRSSPTGGALPFHVRHGISHYFGVGAYMRPVTDADTSGVLFATECLGFANVPDDVSLVRHFGTPFPAVHRPDWKGGVPRDAGAGWDFEDIRDHYLREMFNDDPVLLRYSDKERYLKLSRVVTGEVIRRTLATWRRHANPCGGALIWFLKDLVPGAGWGLLDSDNRPKAAYYFAKRSWMSRHLSIVDLGLDGLAVAVQNESTEPFRGFVAVRLLRSSSVSIGEAELAVEVPAGGDAEFGIDQMLGRFMDTNRAYRFGPPMHDVLVAALLDEHRQALIVDAHFPNGSALEELGALPLTVDVSEDDKRIWFRLTADTFLQSVELKSRELVFGDNYFHLAPGIPYAVSAERQDRDSSTSRTIVSALNSSATLTVR